MKVVLTHVYRDEDLADLRSRLPGIEVVVRPESLADALVDADAVACHALSVPDTARATRLRLVQSLSAGADGNIISSSQCSSRLGDWIRPDS